MLHYHVRSQSKPLLHTTAYDLCSYIQTMFEEEPLLLQQFYSLTLFDPQHFGAMVACRTRVLEVVSGGQELMLPE